MLLLCYVVLVVLKAKAFSLAHAIESGVYAPAERFDENILHTVNQAKVDIGVYRLSVDNRLRTAQFSKLPDRKAEQLAQKIGRTHGRK